jgi:DNA recombination protein RmuC
MPDYLIVAAAALCGAMISWAATRVQATRREAMIAAAEARLFETREQLALAHKELDSLRLAIRDAEQAAAAAGARITGLEEARAGMVETFKAAAADILKSVRQDASADLDARRASIETLLAPVSEALSQYQRETKELEEKRVRDLSAVGEQLRQLATANTTLQSETAKLVNALRSPHVRGRWGEIALRRTAELAGLSEHCDFSEQESVATETGRLRPDMVVKLPAGREVIVDSKVPLVGFLEALEAKSDADREAALDRHTAQLNAHVSKLASKEYWDRPATPEFVICFIPNDSFLAAAAERDLNLIEHALNKRVVIATPTTFIALLRAIAFGWRQEQQAENAQRISQLGKELSDRMAVLAEHLGKIGVGLRRAVDSYNQAVGSFETRVFPSARRFSALGAGGSKAVEELQPIDAQPRSLALPPATETDWQETMKKEMG